jgi:hypothetical protein
MSFVIISTKIAIDTDLNGNIYQSNALFSISKLLIFKVYTSYSNDP